MEHVHHPDAVKAPVNYNIKPGNVQANKDDWVKAIGPAPPPVSAPQTTPGEVHFKWAAGMVWNDLGYFPKSKMPPRPPLSQITVLAEAAAKGQIRPHFLSDPDIEQREYSKFLDFIHVGGSDQKTVSSGFDFDHLKALHGIMTADTSRQIGWLEILRKLSDPVWRQLGLACETSPLLKTGGDPIGGRSLAMSTYAARLAALDMKQQNDFAKLVHSVDHELTSTDYDLLLNFVRHNNFATPWLRSTITDVLVKSDYPHKKQFDFALDIAERWELDPASKPFFKARRDYSSLMPDCRISRQDILNRMIILSGSSAEFQFDWRESPAKIAVDVLSEAFCALAWRRLPDLALDVSMCASKAILQQWSERFPQANELEQWLGTNPERLPVAPLSSATSGDTIDDGVREDHRGNDEPEF